MSLSAQPTQAAVIPNVPAYQGLRAVANACVYVGIGGACVGILIGLSLFFARDDGNVANAADTGLIVLLVSALGGLVVTGFGFMLHAVRDAAQNTWHLRAPAV